MAAIGAALETHIQSASEAVGPAIKLAGCEEGSGRREVDRWLAAVAVDLRAQLKDFNDGWTSPEPKGWHERHPIIYAIGLLIVGVAIGQLDKLPIKNIFD
jgi:hypothetical protein